MFGILDLNHYIGQQKYWSQTTFGPGQRTKGVLEHIRKELKEIEAAPTDLNEWIDVVILALDGAWRAGYNPDEICEALKAKAAKNHSREWPDWRTMSQDQAIEHKK